ncbi:MAG: GDYXXLXY domain-containing protein [Ornithinibacter sp.]
MTTSRTVRVGAAVLAQVLLVMVAVWAPLSARAVGEEVRLRVAPVDPYDPFRGAYVDLGYPDLPGQPTVEVDGRTEEEMQAEQDARGTAYVPLVEKGEVWVGQPVQRTRPTKGVYLTCDDSSWRLECGIDSWFLPQDRASALEAAVRGGNAIARVKVDGRGHAALVGVETS